MLQWVPLTTKYPLLWQEALCIQQELGIEESEVTSRHFVVNACMFYCNPLCATSEDVKVQQQEASEPSSAEFVTGNKNVLKLTGWEVYMYNPQFCDSYGVSRYEPELPIHGDEEAWNYIVFTLTSDRVVIARYGSTDVEFELEMFHEYGAECRTRVELQSQASDDKLCSFILQHLQSDE